jgi:(1->4)-alpha-D-glucan 1-alpha-D-glucosylmutase
VLTEIPEKFAAALMQWSRMNNELRADLLRGHGASDMPDRNTEYLLYQTLIGAWPITEERLQAYMLKAVREAKQRTSWTANNESFEDALQKFIHAILKHEPFVTALEQFVDMVKDAGRVNSLAQTLMKHTAPGVPDLYQGAELWDLSLVDPDNRRPVDYKLRANLLREIAGLPPAQGAAEAMRRADEGLPKLWTIRQALRLRRERPESFGAKASYIPLRVDGVKADHLIAYLRNEDVATLVPRLPASLGGEWDETVLELPKGRWSNRLTGATVEGGGLSIKEVLRDFPVALFVKG